MNCYNLPIGGVSLAVMFAFLHVRYVDESSFATKFKRIDFVGNGILIAVTLAVLYSLTYARTIYS